MAQKIIKIDGENLRLEDLGRIVSDPEIQVEIPENVLAHTDKVRGILNEKLKTEIIYGANTGFGPMASHIISPRQLESLQENLIKSHAVGMGKPIAYKYSLAAMVVRLNTLARGYSGVSSGLLLLLQKFINHRVVPVIPDHGAVGTSGDLVQLAHIGLSLLGEGEVCHDGKRQKAGEVLKKLEIQPYRFLPKEALSLINGTSVMSAIGALLVLDAERLLSVAIRNGAMALELLHAYNDSISEGLHNLRPHPGQIEIARLLRRILADSRALQDRASLSLAGSDDDVTRIEAVVQEIYSLRCIPQILGPIHETAANTRRSLEIEINSSTDNPVFDEQNNIFLHGGNFHGDQVALALDQMKIGIVKLSMLAERRINFFLNTNVNKIFPPFLNLGKPGLTLGLQGLQFVATSTTARNQTLGFPQYLHSIPTNGDNQDVVSMGADAALIADQVVENAFVVLTIEAITLAQAVDFRQNRDELSSESKKYYDKIRQSFPTIVEDQFIVDALNNLLNTLKSADSNLSLRWS